MWPRPATLLKRDSNTGVSCQYWEIYESSFLTQNLGWQPLSVVTFYLPYKLFTSISFYNWGVSRNFFPIGEWRFILKQLVKLLNILVEMFYNTLFLNARERSNVKARQFHKSKGPWNDLMRRTNTWGRP